MARVLLVDDDPDLRLIIATGLEAVGGFEVDVAASGPEGIEAARRRRPDIVVLDVKMPGMDGPATVGAFRREARLADLPVVLLTASIGPEGRAALADLDVAAVLAKPVDPTSLAFTLRGLLEQRPQDGASTDSDMMAGLVRDMWSRLRPRVLTRLDDLDAVQRRAEAGQLTTQEREGALVEAHRLAGSLGTYGFHDASEAARRAEQVLEHDPLDVAALGRVLAQLRRGLSA